MKTITLLVCLLLSLPAIAQDTMTMPDGTVMPASLVGNEYRFNESYYLVDNTTNCQTYNCLILTNTASGGGTVSFVQVSSGYDGSTYGLDGAGNVWTLPFSTTTKSHWTKVAALGAGIKGIAVRSSTEIYALYSDPACPIAYSLLRWDGTAYNGTWGCFFSISVTTDGTLVGIRTDHQIYYTLDPRVTQPTYIGILAPNGATWGNVVGADSLHAFGNVGTILYSIDLSTGASTVVSGAPAISNTTNNMAFSPDGFLYFRSNVATSKGNFYAYSLQNGVFYNMIGTITMLGGNIRDALFAQNGSTLYHYLNTAVGHNSTVSGRYDCGTTGCPAGAVHTATASGLFLHGVAGPNYNSVSGAPASTLTASYNDISEACDPLFGDPTSIECYISQTKTTINNQVKCSVMGMIYSAALATPSLRIEEATTRAIWTGNRIGCITGASGQTWCDFSTANWCMYNPPDLNMDGQLLHQPAYASSGYWDLSAVCASWNHSPWHCTHAFGLGYPTTAQLPKYPCTYNPNP